MADVKLKLDAQINESKRILEKLQVNDGDMNLAFRKAAALGNLSYLKTLFHSQKININGISLEPKNTGKMPTKRTALHNLLNLSKNWDSVVECLVFLLSNGGDPTLKDAQNKTPWDYWQLRRNEIPEKVFFLIEDILQMGILIQKHQEKLDQALKNYPREQVKKFKLILLCEDHFESEAQFNLLKSRLTLLKDLGFIAIGIEEEHYVDLDQNISTFESIFLEMQKLSQEMQDYACELEFDIKNKQETVQSTQHSSNAMTKVSELHNELLANKLQEFRNEIEATNIKLKNYEMILNILKLYKSNEMIVSYIDPRIPNPNTTAKELYHCTHSLRERGMAIVLALSLVHHTKALGVMGLAHGQNVCENLRRIIPDIQIAAFFPYGNNYIQKLESIALAPLKKIFENFQEVVPIEIRRLNDTQECPLNAFDWRLLETMLENCVARDRDRSKPVPSQIVMGYLFQARQQESLCRQLNLSRPEFSVNV